MDRKSLSGGKMLKNQRHNVDKVWESQDKKALSSNVFLRY